MDEEPVSLREFARRIGVSEGAIRKGLDNGRLERAIRRDPTTGRVTLDVALGRLEWERNRDPARVR